MLMATCLIAAGPPMAPLNSSKTITVGTASHSQPIVITPPPPPMDTQRYLKSGHKVTSAVTSSVGTSIKVTPSERPGVKGAPEKPPASGSLGSSRLIKLRKQGNQPLGFSIRGGWEHGTGIYVSEVHRGSEAERQGLMTGDQIVRCNGYSLDQAIHEEVIALIKSSDKISLKVKSCGVLPVQPHATDALSWRLINGDPSADPSKSKSTSKPCPVHAKAPPNNSSSVSSSSSSASSSHSRTVAGHHPRSAGHSHRPSHQMDIEEEPDDLVMTSVEEQQVYVSLSPGQGLGCSVVRGPTTFPGIFVQSVRAHGVAQEAGLELGDQIVGLNGQLFGAGFDFSEAIAQIKASSEMTLVVRKRVGTSLFNGNGQYDANGLATKTIHKIRAVVHHPSSSSGSQHSSTAAHQSCPKHSSTTSSLDAADYSTSEHDAADHFAAAGHNKKSAGKKNAAPGRTCKVHPNRSEVIVTTPSSHDLHDPKNPDAMMVKVRQEEERLADERRKLEFEQKRLREELDKLDKERKQLEVLRGHREDGSSLSSGGSLGSNSSSGAQSLSGLSSASSSLSATSSTMMSTSASSQMGFLDELKKLAERRSSNSDGLLTDTLNKTRHGEGHALKSPIKLAPIHANDEKRKQHELLMEEFKSAHSRMFASKCKAPSFGGAATSDLEVSSSGSESSTHVQSTPPKKVLLSTFSPLAAGDSAKGAHKPVVVAASCAAATEKVTILRTSSPTKKTAPPPPPPMPPAAYMLGQNAKNSGPIVTISSYNSSNKNRFAANGSTNGSSGKENNTGLVRINVSSGN